MGQTIIDRFETRRDAELAVEHFVQDLGLERSDIFIDRLGSCPALSRRLPTSSFRSS